MDFFIREGRWRNWMILLSGNNFRKHVVMVYADRNSV
jgi:hypothetical protein